MANPYGITCDGCGFINTPRTTLTTGRPQFQNGNLHRLEVEQGNITITGRGSNTGALAGESAKVDYFDLVTRTVTIEGPVHAAKLRVYGGQNDFHYANQHIVQRPGGSDGDSPAWALDAAAIGSMYADTIFIKLTEQGAGARVAGQMAATGDDVIITADGMLEVVGQLAAKRNVDIRSNSNININSSAYAGKDLNINAAGQMTVRADGSLFSEGNTNITAEAMLGILGQLSAKKNVDLRSNSNININSSAYAGKDLNINAAGQMTVGADGSLFSEGNTNITAEAMLEILGQLSAKKNVDLRSNSNININSSAYAGEDLNINAAGQMTVGADGSLFSKGNTNITAEAMLEILGQLSAKKNVDLRSNSNININSSAYAGEDLNINEAAQITVGANGKIFSGGNLNITAEQMRVDGQIAAGVNDAGVLSRQSRFIANLNQGLTNLGIIAAGMELQMTAGTSIDNQGVFYSNGTMNLYFNDFTNDEDAEILSAGNLLMARNGSQARASRMINQSGRIESRNGDVTIYSDTIKNNKKNFRISLQPFSGALDFPRFECRELNCYGNSTAGTVRALRERTSVQGNFSTPVAQMLAGGSIRLYANTVVNNYSQISAVGDVYINSNSFTNKAGQQYERYDARNWAVDWENSTRRECTRNLPGLGCQAWDRFYGPDWTSNVYAERNQLGPDAPASIEAGGNITVIATGELSIDSDGGTRTEGVNPNLNFQSFDGISLPTGSNSLFVLNSNPDSPYLIETNPLFTDIGQHFGPDYETNPLFTDLDQYFGSDYFFERSGLSLADFEYYQRLGDPFYETRLIQKQIFEQRGTRFLEEDILDDGEQMRRLFDNAAAAYEDLELSPWR